MLVAICVCILCLCFDVYCELFARGPCQNVQGTDLQAMPRREGRGAADGAGYAHHQTALRKQFPQAGERRVCLHEEPWLGSNVGWRYLARYWGPQSSRFLLLLFSATQSHFRYLAISEARYVLVDVARCQVFI